MNLSLWAAWRGHGLHNELQPPQGISEFLANSVGGKVLQDFVGCCIFF